MATPDLIKNICDQINFRVEQPVSVPSSPFFDPFDVPDLEPEYTQVRQEKARICPDCRVDMYISPDGLACEQCGYVDECGESDTTSDIVNNYNTSGDSAAPVRITGPNHFMFQKKMIADTSNYDKTRRKNTIDQMMNTVYQWPGAAPPKHIVMQAAEMYLEIQQNCIKRGDVRLGTMADCIYKICIANGYIRKPKEIAAMFKIPQYELSNGAKIVDDLIASGKINAPKKNNTIDPAEHIMECYLTRYFESFKIPDKPKYKHFVQRLIRYADKYGISSSSNISSKCAGAMYVLSLACPDLNITKEAIEIDCNISKSTFTKFYKSVIGILKSEPEAELDKKKQSRLQEVFRKSRINLI